MSKKPVIVFEGIEGSGKTHHLNKISKYFYEKQSEFLNIFKMNGAGTINCCVDESYVKKLLAYFKARA